MASKRSQFNITLPSVQANAIEEAATERGVSAAQIIRERLSEWESQSSTPKEATHTNPHPDLAAFSTQLQQLGDQLESLEQAVEQLCDRSTSATQPDPQLRSALQPIYTRLQNLEAQSGVMGNLVQQMGQQIGKQQLRLEAWLEAVYVIVQPLLMDHQPEDVQQGRQEWIKELQRRLETHLEAYK